MTRAFVKTKVVKECRLCGNPRLVPACDFGVMAMTGVFPKTKHERVPRGPLELVRCHGFDKSSCGLLQLKHIFDQRLLFGPSYGYRSGLNPSMTRHLRDIAQDAKKRARLGPHEAVIDIGSSDGTFLSFFNGDHNFLVGVDPLADKFRALCPGKAKIIPDFFNREQAAKRLGGRRAKIIAAIAMLYDLQQPATFFQDAASLLHPEGVLVLEQSYLPLMLENTSYDMICHEHAAHYSLRQIQRLASMTGLKLVDVASNDVNGGSILVFLAHESSRLAEATEKINFFSRLEIEQSLDATSTYRRFYTRALGHRATLRETIHKLLARRLRIAAYGASTKGNVLLQFCGLTPREIEFAAEINPDKWGAWCPATRIPILSEREAIAKRPDVYLVLPWHFKDQILKKEESFLRQGGSFLFPWPRVELVGRSLQ